MTGFKKTRGGHAYAWAVERDFHTFRLWEQVDNPDGGGTAWHYLGYIMNNGGIDLGRANGTDDPVDFDPETNNYGLDQRYNALQGGGEISAKPGYYDVEEMAIDRALMYFTTCNDDQNEAIGKVLQFMNIYHY
ncbi:hypothetical protein KYT24_004361 [Salmonella enterica]|nr:hypothetical protein [Salmonella enterica]